MDKTDRLVAITNDITAKEKAAISHIHNGEYEQAIAVLGELTLLAQKGKELKAEIQKEKINDNDVLKLRNIQPSRISVQNALENGVAKTSKFEKLLNEEMGAKSAFEMRNSDNAWRNDESNAASVVNVQKRDIPDNLADIRKRNDIPRGTFVNNDTNLSIIFGKRSIEETVAKAIQDDKRSIPVSARMSALYQMKELIENAVCFDSQLSEYDPITSKNKTPNTLFMHQLYGAMRFEHNSYLVKLSVEELYFTDKSENFGGTSNRIYNLKDMKITPIEANRIFSPAVADKNVGEDTSTSVTTITIPQLYALVKTYDQSFFENPNAIGRADREAEIELHNDFAKAVKTLSGEVSGEISEKAQIKGADFYETIKSMTEWANKVQEKAEKEKDKSKRNDGPSL